MKFDIVVSDKYVDGVPVDNKIVISELTASEMDTLRILLRTILFSKLSVTEQNKDELGLGSFIKQVAEHKNFLTSNE